MTKHSIIVSYDGKYPNLCSGHLRVTIDGTEWDFGEFCLWSGGSVSFDESWDEHIETGPWTIKKWPPGFPECIKSAVTEAVNGSIPHGCCGGCV